MSNNEPLANELQKEGVGGFGGGSWPDQAELRQRISSTDLCPPFITHDKGGRDCARNMNQRGDVRPESEDETN